MAKERISMFTNANCLLPCTGAGLGTIRAMDENPDVLFESIVTAHEFVIAVLRKVNHI